ncbi:MAG: hypothetical protein ACRD29_19395 [Acidimicrobiales bacterium]
MSTNRLRHTLRYVVATSVAALAVTMLPAALAGAEEAGDTEACTPGYWKNHTDNWLETPGVVIPTNRRLANVFDSLSATFPELANDTFIDALSYGGGPGAQGAAKLLLHHAVAAYLNAAFDDGLGHLQYPLRRHQATPFYPDFAGIIPEVNAALESQDRATMLALKDFVDGIANDLACPLS